jgi:hypothetical protein
MEDIIRAFDVTNSNLMAWKSRAGHNEVVQRPPLGSKSATTTSTTAKNGSKHYNKQDTISTPLLPLEEK